MTNEAYEQIKLFDWVAYARNTYPQLDLLYHVPNGGKRNQKEEFPCSHRIRDYKQRVCRRKL